jgi:ABC-type branched-subunit amino acid transport system substrate-binding protein
MHAVRVGGVAPLTRPGLVPAGRHLKAGLELGVADANQAGGVHGRVIELLVRDTRGRAEHARSALADLHAAGVAAVVGEFHSVVARPLARLAASLGLPFVCSSATLDKLTSAPTDLVARIAPPQSHGWRVYADYLLAAGHEHVALAIQPDEYWSSGAAVIEARLRSSGARSTRIHVTELTGPAVAGRVAELDGVTALLLLVGYPEPVAGIVRAVRSDGRFDHLLIGDPAGRAEFPDWSRLLGGDRLGVPYLRYLPGTLSELGASVASRLAHRLGEPASFVALEGYDTIRVVAEALRVAGGDQTRVGRALGTLKVPGTRGVVQFTHTPGVPVLQWVWPPVQVAAHRGASQRRRVTVLHEEHVKAVDR